MSRPVDIIANAIRAADGNHTMGAEVVATALTHDVIVDHAVQAVRDHSWTGPDVADLSDRDLRAIVRVAFHSIGGA